MSAYNPKHRDTPCTAPSPLSSIDGDFRQTLSLALDSFQAYEPERAGFHCRNLAPAFGMRAEYFAA